MLIVNKSQVHLASNGVLFGEASTLGLGPGEWPDFISVVDDNDSGFLFNRTRPEMCGEDIGSMVYTSKDGFRLVIHND